MLMTSTWKESSTRTIQELWSSMMELMVLLASRSKCRQNVEKLLSDVPKSMCLSVPRTSMLRTTSSTESSTTATQSAVKYDEVDGDGKSIKKSSKSRRLVKESKSFKGLRNLQRPLVRRNVYQNTGLLSTKNSSFYWSSDSFSCSFARPESSLKAVFASIIDKAQLMELLILFWLLTRQS